MKLYHGTDTASLPAILKEGLQPRSITRRQSKWPRCPSHLGFTHLTCAYAMYFALHRQPKEAPTVVILEVDIEGLDLFPDEDFIGQVFWSRRKEIADPYLRRARSLAGLTKRIDPSEYPNHGLLSLEYLGNATVRGVSPDRITRVAHVTTALAPNICMTAMSPSICIQNYRAIGDRYRSLLSLIFDGVLGDGFEAEKCFPQGKAWLEELKAERERAVRIETINV